MPQLARCPHKVSSATRDGQRFALLLSVCCTLSLIASVLILELEPLRVTTSDSTEEFGGFEGRTQFSGKIRTSHQRLRWFSRKGIQRRPTNVGEVSSGSVGKMAEGSSSLGLGRS